MHVLAVYSSRFGHTTRILSATAKVLEDAGHTVEMRPASSINKVGEHVDGVILAGSVHYGFYSPKLKKFARDNAAALNALPTAFMGVSLSNEREGKKSPQTNPYSRKFLEATPWQPTLVRLFGGEINFDLYKGLDFFVMDKILERTGKPHGRGVKFEYTDWDDVAAFAAQYAALLS
ncbi:MAG: flavodoxin domain-containing protein [Buchananella hordeovulneris]|nr:flavodoxin domain-containing protein [Buchananella hordeovulneris]